EGQVAHARHGGQHYRVVQANGADLQGTDQGVGLAREGSRRSLAPLVLDLAGARLAAHCLPSQTGLRPSIAWLPGPAGGGRLTAHATGGATAPAGGGARWRECPGPTGPQSPPSGGW